MKPIAVPLAFLALGVLAPAQSFRSQAETMERHAARAMGKKDVGAFARAVKPTVTPDFRYTDQGQTMGFDKMVSLVGQSLNGINKVTFAAAKILTIHQMGRHGKTTTLHEVAGIVTLQDKKPHKLYFSGIGTEEWIKVGSKWKMKAMDWKNDKMTLDGKPIHPASMQQN